MSDENSKLTGEIIVLKEKLAKIEGKNVELTKENTELKEQNAKFEEKFGSMEQNDSTQLAASNPSSQNMLKSTESEEKAVKRVPNWLIEVLCWIKRVEMANSKLSTSTWTFKQLCWPKLHQNVKPYKIEHLLKFRGEFNDESGNYQAKLAKHIKWDGMEIPIASISPPNYITGFETISILFLDGRVMKFIECIYSKLNGIYLSYGHVKICLSLEQFGQIHRLFEMLAKKASSFGSENFFDFLRFNPNALGLIENVQSIRRVKRPNEWEVNFLIKWLSKSLPDQQEPKLLEFDREVFEEEEDANKKSIFIDKIKNQFNGSTQSSNMFVSYNGLEPDYPDFIMENERTGEVLALYTNPNQQCVGDSRQFLVRHPKGGEHFRAEWEEKFQQQLNKLPRVYIDIKGIGEF